MAPVQSSRCGYVWLKMDLQFLGLVGELPKQRTWKPADDFDEQVAAASGRA